MLKSAALNQLEEAHVTFTAMLRPSPNIAMSWLGASLGTASQGIEVTDEFRMWREAVWMAAKILRDEQAKPDPDMELVTRLNSDLSRFMQNCIDAMRSAPPRRDCSESPADGWWRA